MNKSDPYNLERFILAQEMSYEQVLSELKHGKKVTHWMWYIFPQIAGLGESTTSKMYALMSKDEAVAYLKHPVLGERLRLCIQLVIKHREKSVDDIFGFPDYLKFKSCLTLFYLVSDENELYKKALNIFFNGTHDGTTEKLLGD